MSYCDYIFGIQRLRILYCQLALILINVSRYVLAPYTSSNQPKCQSNRILTILNQNQLARVHMQLQTTNFKKRLCSS